MVRQLIENQGLQALWLEINACIKKIYRNCLYTLFFNERIDFYENY